MNINLKATNITLSPSISEYTDKHFKKVSKLLRDNEAVQCDIELARTTEHHNKGEIFRAEIHIVGGGKNLYASSERSDLYVAIIAVRDEILRELKSKNDKSRSFIRRGGARVKAMVKGLWPWK
jgi:ribosomal subunit interface protein